MACLLKLPDAGSRGVLTVTTQERDNLVRTDPAVAQRLAELKDRWIVGLHHNWHDHQFTYDPLYDFSMAGAEDLVEVSGRPVPLIELDACNFVPEAFHPGTDEPFWDLLYVARPVTFKGFPTFLQTMRTLYDSGNDLRVMCLCPMPPYEKASRKTVLYDVRERYDALFSPVEQDRFTLLTMDFRYPFPLDLPTLAHFYRSSRVFAHFADDERRCRVAGYAWATGNPVVGVDAVGSLLTPGLRRPPQFYPAPRAGDPEAFAAAIVAALDGFGRGYDLAATRREVSEESTQVLLRERLDELFADVGARDASMALDGLSLRLGRHHGLSEGANRVPMQLSQLLARLETVDDGLRAALATDDPERTLAAAASTAGDSIAMAPARSRRGLRRLGRTA
jgi:glycosyltransferase involved in cell wall biosynthesis